MATSGKARTLTIRALSNHEPFKRAGYGMSAVSGKPDGISTQITMRMPEPYATQYLNTKVVYTVLSYGIPILWITETGETVSPEVKYSVTTSSHQNLARAYLG